MLRCISCLLADCHASLVDNSKQFLYCCTLCCTHKESVKGQCFSIQTKCIFQMHFSSNSKDCSTLSGRLCLVKYQDVLSSTMCCRVVPLCEFHSTCKEDVKEGKSSQIWKCMETTCLRKGIKQISGHSGESLFHCSQHHEEWLRDMFSDEEESKSDDDFWEPHIEQAMVAGWQLNYLESKLKLPDHPIEWNFKEWGPIPESMVLSLSPIISDEITLDLISKWLHCSSDWEYIPPFLFKQCLICKCEGVIIGNKVDSTRLCSAETAFREPLHKVLLDCFPASWDLHLLHLIQAFAQEVCYVFPCFVDIVYESADMRRAVVDPVVDGNTPFDYDLYLTNEWICTNCLQKHV